VVGEPRDGAAQEPDFGGRGLVGQDLDVGQVETGIASLSAIATEHHRSRRSRSIAATTFGVTFVGEDSGREDRSAMASSRSSRQTHAWS
jgi:hypothetical protein